jgi:hypothetical protein
MFPRIVFLSLFGREAAVAAFLDHDPFKLNWDHALPFGLD